MVASPNPPSAANISDVGSGTIAVRSKVASLVTNTSFTKNIEELRFSARF
jgi:hypothetical protein